MKDDENFRRGIIGLRILAVGLLTLITLVLTILMAFDIISTGTFFLMFLVWYLLTVLFMLATGGLRIKDKRDFEMWDKHDLIDPEYNSRKDYDQEYTNE